jgi:hypothetical protein
MHRGRISVPSMRPGLPGLTRCKGGVAAPSKKWSRSEKARTGWSITGYRSGCVLNDCVWLTTLYVSRCRAHASRPSAALRWLRDFLLMPQPPLLCRVESSPISGFAFQNKVTAASKRIDTNVSPVAIRLLRRSPYCPRSWPSYRESEGRLRDVSVCNRARFRKQPLDDKQPAIR